MNAWIGKQIRKGRVASFALSVHERGVVMKRSESSRAVKDAHPAAIYSKSLCESQELFCETKGGFFHAEKHRRQTTVQNPVQ